MTDFAPYSRADMSDSDAMIEGLRRQHGGLPTHDRRCGNYQRDDIVYQALLSGWRPKQFQIKFGHKDLPHLLVAGKTEVVALWDPKDSTCQSEIATEPQRLCRRDGTPFEGRNEWSTHGWTIECKPHHHELAYIWKGGR
jgi:hypothetical protein